MEKLSQLMNLGSNAKLVNLARLGSRYCSRLKLRGQKEQFLNLLMSTLWSNELNIKGTTLASLEQGNPEHLQLLSSSYLLKEGWEEEGIIGSRSGGVRRKGGTRGEGGKPGGRGL